MVSYLWWSYAHAYIQFRLHTSGFQLSCIYTPNLTTVSTKSITAFYLRSPNLPRRSASFLLTRMSSLWRFRTTHSNFTTLKPGNSRRGAETLVPLYPNDSPMLMTQFLAYRLTNPPRSEITTSFSGAQHGYANSHFQKIGYPTDPIKSGGEKVWKFS